MHKIIAGLITGLVVGSMLGAQANAAGAGDELEHAMYTSYGVSHPNIGLSGNAAGLTYNSNTKLFVGGGLSSVSLGLDLGNRRTAAMFGASYAFSGLSPLSTFAGLAVGGSGVALGVGTTLAMSPFAISTLTAGLLFNRDGKFKVGTTFSTTGTNFATGVLGGGIELGGGNFAFNVDLLYSLLTRLVNIQPAFMFGSQKFKATAGVAISPGGVLPVFPGTFGVTYQVATNTYFAIQMVGIIFPSVNIFAKI